MTGCTEPDCCLVITFNESTPQVKSVMFTRDHDPHSEKWDGPRTNPESALEVFGVEDALPASEMENYLSCLFKSNKSVCLW